MILEFIGLPGSGKTTLKRFFLKKSNVKCVDQRYVVLNPYLPPWAVRVIQRYSLTKRGLPHPVVKPLITLAKYRQIQMLKGWGVGQEILFQNLVQSVPGEASPARRLLLALESICHYELVKDDDELTIFDEGPAQRGVTLARCGGGCGDLKQYYAHIPKPSLLVVTEAADHVIKKRLKIRDGDSPRLMRHQKAMKQAIDICVIQYRVSGTPILRICTDNGIPESGTKLNSQIKKYLNL